MGSRCGSKELVYESGSGIKIKNDTSAWQHHYGSPHSASSATAHRNSYPLLS